MVWWWAGERKMYVAAWICVLHGLRLAGGARMIANAWRIDFGGCRRRSQQGCKTWWVPGGRIQGHGIRTVGCA